MGAVAGRRAGGESRHAVSCSSGWQPSRRQAGFFRQTRISVPRWTGPVAGCSQPGWRPCPLDTKSRTANCRVVRHRCCVAPKPRTTALFSRDVTSTPSGASTRSAAQSVASDSTCCTRPDTEQHGPGGHRGRVPTRRQSHFSLKVTGPDGMCLYRE